MWGRTNCSVELSKLSPAAVSTYSLLVKIIRDLNVSGSSGSFIDVGCGDLTFSWIVEESLDRTATGFDRVFRGQVTRRSRFILSDAGKIPVTDSKIGVLTSNFLLEHLDNPMEFLSEIVRVLSDDGVALVSVNGPNWHIARMLRFLIEEAPTRPRRLFRFLKDPTRYLAHGSEWTVQNNGKNQSSIFEETRNWSPDRWSDLFTRSGLEIIRTYNSAPIWSLVSYGFVKKKNRLDKPSEHGNGIHITYLVKKGR